MIKNCLVCENKFSTDKWYRKFCSRICAGTFKRGKPTWIKGKHLSKIHKKHISESIKKWGHPESWRSKTVGNNAVHWQENPNYFTVHAWIRKRYNKLSYCEFCKKSKVNLQIANKSHKNLREISDWLTLCVPCHKKYDLNYLKSIRAISAKG